jgi:MFS family permease
LAIAGDATRIQGECNQDAPAGVLPAAAILAIPFAFRAMSQFSIARVARQGVGLPHRYLGGESIMEVVYAAVVCVSVVVCLSVVALWIRDRGGILGTVVGKTLGALALVIGVTIIGWFIYNLFAPTPEFRSSYRTVFQLAVPIGLVWFGWRSLTSAGPGLEQVSADLARAELMEAAAKARETLPWFIEQVERNVDGAFVKFPLTSPYEGTEHVWGYVHCFRDGAFNVSLATRPYDRAHEPSGRRDVQIDQVEDWQIVYPDGTIKGAYSLIALFQHFESTGRKLGRKMRLQKAQLIDAEPSRTDHASRPM